MSDDDGGRVRPELTDHRRVLLPADKMGAETVAQVDISVEGYDVDDVTDLHDTIVEAIEEAVPEGSVDSKTGGVQLAPAPAPPTCWRAPPSPAPKRATRSP